MKKEFIFALTLLLSIAGCRSKRDGEIVKPARPMSATNIDVPVVEDSTRSFFDEDINEFSTEGMMDDMDVNPEMDSSARAIDVEQMYEPMDEFMWQEEEENKQASFQPIYFDWDSQALKEDQKEIIAQNVEIAKQMVEECEAMGMSKPTFVIDGHTSSAGTASESYKIALSEKRAQVLGNYLIEQGIPQECIKVVGRGSEMPAVIEGKVVDGDRQDQWANRRDEIRVIYT